ncbi:male-specific lethal 1-like 1 [Mercenaria mercenaria]|uniref:male-specific lethal 1-like 1 n=1 Tax=Mercenaria mercenaria TaxID=6596 RepID=UPI001E1DAD04|nr:male-specific lethal 1-like 1 [Mercenaria mercenaria]
MTGRSVYPNMLFNSKTRSHVQPSSLRRRLTKSAATVDGEYDPDLALAIQESLKQAEIDALKAKEKQSDTLSKIENNMGKENRSRKMSNSSGTQELSTETKQLKDLVCVHMDLIQQQQDVISQKDKTIKTLKAENNALQCRLQRMERRMALLKQKEEMAGSTHIVTSPPPKPGTMSYTEPIVSPLEKQSHRKKLETTTQPKKTADLPKTSLLKTPSANLDINKNKYRESHRKRKITSVQATEGEGNTLETNNLYFVSYYEPVSDEVEVDSRSELLKSAQSQIDIEVPSFRVKTFTNLYVIEGTEDHEDETFMRRHQKPEIEEKRRKRWDDQRLREERMMERLRQKQESRHKYRKPEDPVESFYPCLDDITHIEVIDKIPVTAFGQPIPFTKSEPFMLPWNPKQTSTSSSSHRHRQK